MAHPRQFFRQSSFAVIEQMHLNIPIIDKC